MEHVGTLGSREEYPKFVPPCTYYVWEYFGSKLLGLVFEEYPHVPFDINSANV